MRNNDNGYQLKEMLLSAGIAMLSLLFVFAVDGFFPLGQGSIVALDLNSQYTPLLYRFYDVVSGAKNIAIDFHLGGGINLYSDTLTELLNPYNYILLLFGRANIYKAVNVLLLFYVIDATVSANFVLYNIFPKTNRFLRVALSVSYSMSYFCAYQYEIIRWMYIIVLFPWLFMALKRMLEKEKPVAFVLLLGYILMLSFQFGIQLCIFVFVYSTCYIFEKRKTINYGRICLVTGVSLIAALLISAPSTVPTVINIMNSARSTQNSSLLTVITHHGLDNILERILEISNPIALGVIVAAAIVRKKCADKSVGKLFDQNRVLIWSLLILIATAILEPSNLLWHLGSYQCFPVRYGYIVVFLMSMLACAVSGECECIYSETDELRTDIEASISDEKLETAEHVKGIKNCEKQIGIVALVIALVISALIIGFVYTKRLAFAQAFATLDISGVCKKETFILYVITAVIVAVTTVLVVIANRFDYYASDSNRKFLWSSIVIASALMGIVWYMANLWPQTSEARVTNEANYSVMNAMFTTTSSSKSALYKGHTREVDSAPLNSALVDGSYSMSAYVPSGEGLEYVSAMQKLGYETPWISVTQNGGNEQSDMLLGLEGDFFGAAIVTRDEFEQIRNISDCSKLLKDRQPNTIVFDNRKGTVSVHLYSDELIRLLPESQKLYLLLPMAYIDGWSCEQGSITNYLDGFLAIELSDSASVMCVTLKYNVPGLRLGLILFVVGIAIIYVLSVFLGRIKDESFLNKLARVVYKLVLCAFVILVYALPNLGLLVYGCAKAAGKDFAPYLESGKTADKQTHTLLSQTMEEDGLHVLVGLNNLMLDKSTRITSSDDENATFRASKAADGDKTTDSRWSSANNWDDNEHVLQATFDESKNIQAINIYWERTNACEYAIEISEDGQNWNVVSIFDEPVKTNPQTIFYPDGIRGKYVRLHVTNVTKNEDDLSLYYQNIGVCEFEVYDDACDSFVVKTPELTSGVDRKIVVPEVPEGYLLKFGGVDYENLVVYGDTWADTIDAVDVELGYKLYCEDECWDLDGFKLELPASESDDGYTLPFADTKVCEWKAEDGELDLTTSDTLVDALKDRNDNEVIEVSLADGDNYLGEEGYEIQIRESSIKLIANTERGIYQGLVTLSHMVTENDKLWPCGTIRDYPKYSVRGFVLDVARRPISMDFLYEVLDTLADNHMNTLQLHLSDNAIITSSDYDGTVEGARELFSAFRLESSIGVGDDKLTSEFHYTDEELAKFIDDAKALGIDVVPEIDTPAHSMAFTKLFPELGFDSDSHLADSFDVTKPEVLEFTKNLWSEYLVDSTENDADNKSEQNSGKTALFNNCAALNIGMDEYYGDSKALTKYIANVTKAVKGMAPDKTIRMWACTQYCGVDLAQIDRNTQIMYWSSFWDNPTRLYDAGFSIINCLSDDLYIIAGNGEEKTKGLDIDKLATDWQPNQFYGADIHEKLPAWSQQIIGACYALWNDQYSLTGHGPKDDELLESIKEPAKVLGNKLW